MKDIVVGVDGSPGAAAALRWAVREGALHRARVTAAMAWGVFDQHHVVGDEFDPSYCEADALEALDAAIGAAMEPSVADTVQATVVCDHPARGLLERAAVADLLVVGARGVGGFPRLLVGSVSDQCMTHAACPVAVVRAAGGVRPSPDCRRVVVGFDGSASSRRALRWAAEEATVHDATLEVVQAWMPRSLGPFVAVDEPAARAMLDAAVDQEVTSGHPARVEATLLVDPPARALVARSDRANLLVVGSRGYGGFKGLLLGSVSRQVAHHASCPVVIVRSGSEVDEMEEP